MSCISTSTISILVNGSRTYFFRPSRGIRHGYPMSPYIFILCMEMLSVHINHQVNLGVWEPIKISPKPPFLSHLFYAYDLTLMPRAHLKSIDTIVHSLKWFCALSGQSINHSKSKIIFSNTCSPSFISLATSTLGIQQSFHFGKYLGFNILFRAPKHFNFN